MSKKRYQDGGVVGNTNYPFGQGQQTMPMAAQPAKGLTQQQEAEPNATGPNAAELSRPFGLKKGGNVKGWGMARGARAAKIV